MNVPQNISRSNGARRAWAQPRFLLGAAALTVAGATLASFAQTSAKAPVAMPHTSSAGKDGPVNLSDLPALMAQYGESRRLASVSNTGGRTTRAVGTGNSGFNLVETDLTSNTRSDEREPIISPSDNFIAFTSTGTDADKDGKIDPQFSGNFRHIWIMARDGSSQRQLTGLGADANRNQTHPTWSPDGNQIAYTDEEPATVNGNPNPNAGGSQLYVLSSVQGNPTSTKITFFGENGETKSAPARVESPAWSPSGLGIAFVTNYDGRQRVARTDQHTLPNRDIFTIAPSGSDESINRITGDSGDPVGATTDDDHPAWGIANTNVLFFSSNRDKNGLLTDNASTPQINEASGRRIWRIFSDGTSPSPVTDPLQRENGQADDQDDYPATSLARAGGVNEQLAFQTNTYLDDTDQADGAPGRDLNVWSIPITTGGFVSAPEPRVYVSSYDSNRVIGVNTNTLQQSTVVSTLPDNGSIQNPEGVVVTRDNGINYVYVSDRGNNLIGRFLETTGANAGNRGATLPSYAFTPNTVPNPTAMQIYGGFIYVASGYSPGDPNTSAIYRFSQATGDAVGNDPAGTGLFSSGETAANGGAITNGSEGLAINSNGRFIAVSEVSDGKVNLYDLTTGAYLFNAADNASLVRAGAANNAPVKPTGLTWGPDLNNDTFQDLYVCSSGDDSIKVYAGPNPAAGVAPFTSVGPSNNVRPGTFIKNLVADPGNGLGAGSTGLNGPEQIVIQDLAKHDAGGDTEGSDGIPEIYVSSFRTLGQGDAAGGTTPVGGGYQINRYELDTNNVQALPWPANAPAPSAPPTTNQPQVNAAWVSLPQSLVGPGGFDFNKTAVDRASGVAAVITPDETAGSATVQTNILSSPQNFSDSKLAAPQAVDRSADGQPTLARSTSSSQAASRLVFVSGRTFAPNTSSNGTATPANPYGGDGNYILDSNTPAPGVTHDIWTTSRQDTTPPVLIPQGVGNLQTPVVAPQPNAPFFAPRTAEAGLRAGLNPTAAERNEIRNASTTTVNSYAKRGGLRFAVVLRDTESGFAETDSTNTNTGSSSVSIIVTNAKATQYTPFIPIVNDNIEVNIAREDKASTVASYPLNVYDDGPVSSGGHEQQADAVAGDGNFYCEGLIPTPATGDYYVDVNATDRANNNFLYDNIWGFSTESFSRPNVTSDLFVSDYTCGQVFRSKLGNDARQANMPPVESYYLTNPAGTTTAKGATTANGSGTSSATTLTNVDVWRTLSRGPVPVDVLNIYRPTIIQQIDPNVPNPTPLPTATPEPGATATPTPGPNATPTATPLPFSQLTRNVAVSTTAIFWAAPYAGTTFVGPGTIVDPLTQANLSSFLNDGGRLFISGRDIAWALSSAGGKSNTFLNNELAANYAGEVDYQNGDATAEDAGNGFLSYDGYKDIQFASRRTRPTADLNQWNDAALSNNPNYNPQSGNSVITYYGPGAYQIDRLTATTPNGATVLPAYTALKGAANVGQRIQVTRASGIQSRAVYFSFGFESVNRRYKLSAPSPVGVVALDARRDIASKLKRYFKTGSVSGIVTNSDTNLPVANFLLRITGGGDTFFVRTGANGRYELSGLPDGGYRVSTYTDANGLTSPQGFFGGTSRDFTIIGGSPTLGGQDLVVIPTRPGAVLGRAVTSNGTFNNRNDDTPLPNITVLIRSVGESPVFVPVGTGKFARTTTTNAAGNFSFSNVPAQAEMEVIFNPTQSDVPEGANITLPFPNGNPNYGRRVLPDQKRPNNPIIVPSGDNFVLNDTGTVTINGTSYTVDTTGNPDTAADERVPVLVPLGPTISGVISVNGNAVAGATVQLLKEDGTATTNPVQVTGTGGTTGTNGAYSFVDVAPGIYFVRASITRDNITFVRDIRVTLTQGKDQTQDINLNIATLTGKVVLSNGQAVANATVTLKSANGADFLPARTAKTNAQGVYTIANVPVGGYQYTYDAATQKGTAKFATPSGNVAYSVVAVSGSLSGSSGNFSVNALATTVNVPDIKLVSQQVSGRIYMRYVTIGGDYVLPFGGATVELVDVNGNSLSPKLTTTSASNGVYSFPNATAGTYRAKVTGKGDVVITNSFTVVAGQPSGANATLVTQGLSGDVIDTSGKRVQGATVTLTQNGTVLGTTTTDVQGAFSFEVAEGDGYALKAVKGSTSGTANVGRVVRGVVPKRALITLLLAPTVTPKPTSFTKGSTYAVSFPYETSTNATSRNVYDRSRADATISLADAFNYAPMGQNSAGQTVRYYSVSRFNPNTLAYEAIPDNGVLVRGEGYLLQVVNVPPSGEILRFATPSDNAALKALTAGTTVNLTRFDIYLVYNSSLAGNGLNGRNFIGFGFDPAKYGALAWDTTSTGTDGANKTTVQVFYNNQVYTVKDAAAAGLINPTLLDGTTGRATDTLNAFGGYFVTARKPGVALRLRFPLAN